MPRFKLDNPLGVGDHPYWHLYPLYSQEIANFLKPTMPYILHPPTYLSQRQRLFSEYSLRARLLLRHSRGMPLQHLNLFYILAACTAEIESVEAGLTAYTTATAFAWDLREWVAVANLLLERARLFRRVDRFAEASDDCVRGLDLLKQRPAADPLSRRPLRLRLLSFLAVDQYMLGHFHDGRKTIDDGLNLCGREPSVDRFRASFLWTGALVSRGLGLSSAIGSDLLSNAAEAARILQPLGEPCARARVQAVVADLAADLLVSGVCAPGSSSYTNWVQIADKALDESLAVATAEDDVAGAALARLAAARLASILRRDLDVQYAYESIHYLGESLQDLSLKTQALTGLGDHFRRAGDFNQAQNLYLGAINAATSDIRGLSASAWQSLSDMRG